MGAGGAVLLLFVAAVLLIFIVIGVVVLVVAAGVGLSGRDARPLFWGGGIVLAVPVVFVVGVAVFAQVTGDPDTIELDLRDPVRLSSLPDDNESFPGMRDYDSDHVDLLLPGGRHFEADVDGVAVWSKDGYVTQVTFDRRARDAGEAQGLARAWERQLGETATVEVDPDYSDHGRVRGEVLADPTP
ncbi:hypothetical protein FB381_0548 [Nocardioides albertanoniae]|uniref:Uncharacterized protein n=1 Tax=Nocardioides albertanoniae TaxID=1175486 RepID=A0A543A276_9ACTN|nr:hypothetical protein [Nocardioides albertanoniae]TQL66684.1 hypothetical protein FB381_0548 [Nocardioides albertanoniae]